MNSTSCNNPSHHPINKKYYLECKNENRQECNSCCGIPATVIQCVIYALNLLLATCGLAILALSLVNSLPNTAYIRSIIPMTHPLNLVLWTTIFTAALISLTAIISLVKSCLLNCSCKKSQSQMIQVEVIRSNGTSRGHRQMELHDQDDHMSLSVMSNGHHSISNSYSSPASAAKNPSKLTNASSRVVQSAYSLCSMIFLTIFFLSIQLTVAVVGVISSSSYSAVPFYKGHSIEYLLDPLNKNETFQFIITNNNSFSQIESHLKCCGLVDYSDYLIDTPVPDSCCRSITRGCGSRKHPSNIYYEGCARKIEARIFDELSLISSVAFALSCLQVSALTFTSCLYIFLLKRPTYL